MAKAKDLGNVTLKDVNGGGKIKVGFVRERDKLGTCLHPEGHGTHDGDYAPVMLEMKDGTVRVIVWANIHQKSHAHHPARRRKARSHPSRCQR